MEDNDKKDGSTFNPDFKIVRVIIGAVIAVIVFALIFSPKDAPPVDRTPAVTPVAAQTAPTTTPAQPSAPEIKTYKLGEDVAAGKLGVIASDFRSATEYKTKYSVEKTENQFVIINVKVTNNDDRARDISSNMFTLIDAVGKTYKAYSKTIIDDAVLSYETVNPGISRSKSVIFETPKDVNVAKLRVESGVAFAGGQPVDIDLNAK